MPLFLLAGLVAAVMFLYVCSNGLQSATSKVVFLLAMLLLGAAASWFVPDHVAVYPLPHQVPKYPNGIALRFAMVHDVLHDRYPRHGKAYYQERNRQILAQLAAEAKGGVLTPAERDSLIDDLGVGYDQLGQPDEGARVLRQKLQDQLQRGLEGRALYTTYANLGTFIIHANMAQARLGRAASAEQVGEGLGFIRKAIEVNPEAHFGREMWQAVLAEFLLAAAHKPELLLQFDMVGNALGAPIRPFPASAATRFARQPAYEELARLVRASGFIDPGLRDYITTVGAAWGWPNAVSSLHTTPVAFDEPVLGIIGMWRLGGGANPHFALALGETMRRVGQNRLAWCAFARAIREADRFSADPKARADFVGHCQSTQQEVAAGFRDLPPFEAELARGQQYQQAYQRYEEEQIATGRPLDDPHFYDAFHATHPPIASPVGDADFMEVSEPVTPAIPLMAGFFCLVGGVFLHWRARYRQSKSQTKLLSQVEQVSFET
jgi:hypothetical protein